MKRNITGILEEYRNKHAKHKGADISVTEVREIERMAKGDMYSALLLIFQYGYAIGHRHGLKQARQTASNSAGIEAC